jgi:hypothetical protein
VSNNWTHPICERCWEEKHPGAVYHYVVNTPERTCCFCGAKSLSGIFVHQNPVTVPCVGKHPEAKP